MPNFTDAVNRLKLYRFARGASDPHVRQRREEVDRISGPVLEELHTERCRVLPSRSELLDLIPKGAITAELGVAAGDFSAEILERSRPSVLHLVDPWDTDRYGAGLGTVMERFHIEITSGKVIVDRGYSTDVLERFSDASLDFIYIDTTHAYDLTLAELRIGARKVKSTGLLAGHDFCVGNIVTPVVYGVVQACCQFCNEADWTFKYLTLEPHGHWSFCLERRSRPQVGL